MFTVGEAEKKEYAEKFNRILGDKLGKPMSIPKSNAALNSMVSNATKMKAAQELASNKAKPKPKSSKTKSPSLTDAQKEALRIAMTKKLAAEIDNKGQPWYKDIAHAGMNVLDKLQIPAALVSSTMAEAIDTVQTSRVGDWLDLKKDDKDKSKGSVSQIWNQAFHYGKNDESSGRKMGWGDIVGKEGGTGNSWVDRGIGFAGEMVMDPLNYVGLGEMTKVAKGAGLLDDASKAAKLLEGADKAGKVVHNAATAKSEAGKLKKFLTVTGPDVKKTDLTGLDAVKSTVEHNARAALKEVAPHLSGTELEDDIVSKLGNIVEDTTAETLAGSKRGRLTGGGAETHATLGHNLVEPVRNHILEPSRETIKKFQDMIADGTWHYKKNVTWATEAAKKDPLFAAYRDGAHDVLKAGKGTAEEAAAAGLRKMNEQIEPTLKRIFDKFVADQADSLAKVPSLRIMGKDVLEFPRLGEAAGKFGKKFGNKYGPVGKAFRFSANNPGATILVHQRNKARGMAAADAFAKEANAVFKGATRAERVEVARRVQENLPFSNPRLETMRRYTIDSLKKMYDEEVTSGVRSADKTPYAANYMPIHENRPTRTVKTKQVRLDRAKDILKNGEVSPQHTTMGLKASGHKVNEDALELLLHRKLASTRKMAPGEFDADLIGHYGVKSFMDKHEAADKGLVQTNLEGKFPGIAAAERSILKDGEKFYLPEEIDKVSKYYKILLKSEGSPEANDFIRTLDWVTNKFKVMNTIYFPGFHVRNMISDMFFGGLDGVTLNRYKDIIEKYPRRDRAFLEVGGKEIKFDAVVDSYKKNAASGGFYPTDVPSGVTVGGHTISSGVRKGSMKREDLGRLVHYYHALDQEVTAGLKKGWSYEKAFKNAEASATQRVNWYKFDYNALTDVERKYMRRGMPFYTYSRKAIPAILEAVYQNPRWLNLAQKGQEALQEQNPEGMPIPKFLRDLSFGALPGQNDSKTPFGLTNELLPQNLIKEKLDPTKVAQNMNPILQAIFEAQTGKDTFSNKPVHGPLDILKNKSRAYGVYKTSQSDKASVVKYLNFLGIPLKQNSERYQDMAVNEMKGSVENKLNALKRKYNMFDNGYNLYFTVTNDGASLRLKHKDDKKYLAEFKTLEDAERYLKERFDA